MQLKEIFPFYDKLTASQQDELKQGVQEVRFRTGESVYDGERDCLGLLAVQAGALRAYAISAEGKEITLFRIGPGGLCLMTASCAIAKLTAFSAVMAQEETRAVLIPAALFKRLMQESLPVANLANELMAARFSEIVWLLDQVLNQRMDARIAAFLLEESKRQGSSRLALTHEEIARHLGTAREVVSRILKHLAQDGLVENYRGGVQIIGENALRELAENSLRNSLV